MGSGKDDERAEGGHMARMVARAEAAVADLARNYTAWASADVATCAVHLAAARAASGEGRTEHVRDIHAVAHNIKGQGSSFGYPLMTRLGQSLCQLTRRKPAFSDADLDLAQAHIDAMKLVLAKEIQGDGGELGQKLGARLEERVRAALEAG
jgi:HPt (histidine-containing phosphotransfer) domain-containing protein